jgi:hypothetical protein
MVLLMGGISSISTLHILRRKSNGNNFDHRKTGEAEA